MPNILRSSAPAPRHPWVGWLGLLAAASLLAATVAFGAQERGAVSQGGAIVAVLDINGAIGPATADYVARGLQRAQARHARLIVLRIDTPGGLDTSMRQIIKAILASPIPVAAFVAPEGARAASAGTYIVYASHVAAMAPATSLGAATPVAIGLPGGTPSTKPAQPESHGATSGDDKKTESKPLGGDAMTAKQVNDAAAYIRGLAELRGRNADWGERAVREAVSLSSEAALKQHVIDVIAIDVPALLRTLDGREVKVLDHSVKLELAGAAVESLAPDWRTEFLGVITNPSVALILLLIGVYGLFFEFSTPTFGVAGVAGGICLLLGLYALQLLPVNYAGLALLLLGLALMVAEAFVPSFGVLGLGGIAAFVLGATLLIDVDIPGFGVPLGLIVALALSSALLLVGVGGLALRARRRAVVSGREELIGAPGEVIDADGWAFVHGERWRVTSDRPLAVGDKVRVRRIDGLTLTVEPLAGGNATGRQKE